MEYIFKSENAEIKINADSIVAANVILESVVKNTEDFKLEPSAEQCGISSITGCYL